MVGLERDDDTPQHKAIREAMTNCIIHADLMLNGVLKVEKYDNKFVFTNPGLLKLPVEQIYAGEETKARNQRIQNMFRMIGFGENLGSGFPLILSAWNEKHWLKPQLIEQRDLLQVKLILFIEAKSNGSFISQDDKKDSSDIVKELLERHLVLLKMINADPALSAKVMSEKMSEKTSIDERTIERDIAKLKKLGVLTRKGGRKDGEWILTELGLAILEQLANKNN